MADEKSDSDHDEYNSNKIVIGAAVPGTTVGEYALLYNKLRSATLTATVDSKVWGITAEQFQNLRQQLLDRNFSRFKRRSVFGNSSTAWYVPSDFFVSNHLIVVCSVFFCLFLVCFGQ